MQSIYDRLKKYQAEFDKYEAKLEDEVELQGKVLETALVDQISMQLKWNRLYAKVYALRQEAKMEAEAEFGRAFTSSTGNAYKSVSSTEAKHHAMCDDAYILAKQRETKVIRLEKEVEGVVDVIESRKYVLKDITSTVIKDCNGKIL